jgi:GNAT superfamily N-acetyltransferase
METREENDVVTITFRVARLPRDVRIDYWCSGEELAAGLERKDGFLVAEEGREICACVGLTAHADTGIARVDDLVVDRRWRRLGVGTALLKAAAQWGREQGLKRLVGEVQTKNHPGIRLCQSLGLTFCGYNDHYWSSQDIALFFGESLR